MRAVRHDSEALDYCNESIQQDKRFLIGALRQDDTMVHEAKGFQQHMDEDILFAIMLENPLYIPTRYPQHFLAPQNRNIIMRVLRTSPHLYE